MTRVAANELGPVHNIGVLDRSIRLAIGAAMIGAVLSGALGNAFNFLAILAVYPCMTGMLGYDPLYSFRRVDSYGAFVHDKSGAQAYQVEGSASSEMACNDDSNYCVVGEHRAKR